MQNLTPTSNPNSNHNIEHHVIHERIRQARNAFNLTLTATAVSTIIGFCGAIALFTGQVPEGSITTAVGFVSSIHCNRLAKDANDRLDKLIAELDD